MAGTTGRRTLDELYEQAAARIERLEPEAALAAQREGAVLVDIRSDSDRACDGVVPGALHVPRTVLEWRLQPEGAWQSPYGPAVDDRVVLMCDHGYGSTLAAAALADLGFEDVGDVVGGFAAWRDAGLPVFAAPARNRPPGELPGMGPPDA